MFISDVKNVNQVIASLYDTHISVNNRIFEFFDNLAKSLYFDKAYIFIFYRGEDGAYYKHSTFSGNLCDQSPEEIKQYDECHITDIYPMVDNSIPILYRASDFFDLEKRKKNKCWDLPHLPDNFFYSIEGNLPFKSNKGLKGGICFYRDAGKIDFTETDLEIVALMQPHLINILNYYDENDYKTNTISKFEKHEYIGVALLDDNYKVIENNHAYKKMTSFSESGLIINNKILALCMDIKRDAKGLRHYSCKYKFENLPIFVEVSKIEEGEEDFARYFCTIYDLAYFFNYSLNQIREGSGLTIREFKVLQAILRGKSNEEIASELFLSLPTVKKYLASVYNKLEVKSQKQILELLKIY